VIVNGDVNIRANTLSDIKKELEELGRRGRIQNTGNPSSGGGGSASGAGGGSDSGGDINPGGSGHRPPGGDP
jgi:hypothetical protein